MTEIQTLIEQKICPLSWKNLWDFIFFEQQTLLNDECSELFHYYKKIYG